MQSKAMQCQARISKAMPDEAYQSFANKGKPYDDNDKTLFGVHAQVSLKKTFFCFKKKCKVLKEYKAKYQEFEKATKTSKQNYK